MVSDYWPPRVGFIPVHEVSAFLKMSERSVVRLAERGALEITNIGGNKITRESLISFLGEKING